MYEQKIVIKNNDYSVFEKFIVSTGYTKILLVCGRSIERLKISKILQQMEARYNICFVRFSDFQPNPQYDSVVNGIRVFKQEQCEAILTVGGGSAIDVAKCIKLFCNMDLKVNYLEQEIIHNNVKLFVVPTTSGTGSEATRFAVIYYKGEKQSVSDLSCIPSTVVFDASTLDSLPDYQRKATMMDAFCHAIESFWSVNSTKESRKYSKIAIRKIEKCMESYLANESVGNEGMLEASYIAGKAINITQTTAGHAMCYKLTSLYGLAHGHAAALCASKLWLYMIDNIEKCTDPRGIVFLKDVFNEMADAFGCSEADKAADKFAYYLKNMQFDIPDVTDEEYELLKKSVNPVRLKNNPVKLEEKDIDSLYHEILRRQGES